MRFHKRCMWPFALAFALPVAPIACAGANMARLHQPTKRLVRRGGGGISRDEIRSAVERALERKKWTLEAREGSAFIATVKKGENWATVKIETGAGTYKIHHIKSGPSFMYSGDVIHRRYNRWVQRLDAAIIQEVSGVYILDPDSAPEDADADDLKL